MVPIADDSQDAEFAGMLGLLGVIAGSGMVPPSEMEASAAVEAGAWCHIYSPMGDMACTCEHLEHAAGDDRGVKGLHILTRSTAGTLVGISHKRSYRSPEPTTGLPVDVLSASLQESVRDTPSVEHGRCME